MMYENKPGTGALFKREKRGEKQPDYSGPFYEAVGNGVVERQIAAWSRRSKKGEEYLSIQVSDKFEPRRVGPPLEKPPRDDDPPHDDPGW